jgi:hypothetical protein
MRIRVMVACTVAASLLTACDDGMTPLEAHDGEPSLTSRSHTPQSGPQVKSYDAELEGLVDEIHGFGGMFVENGRLHVYTKAGRSLDGRELDVLENFLTNRIVSGTRPERGVSDVVILSARYDYRQLRAMYGTANDITSELPITISDIDERHNRISIGLLNAEAVEYARVMVRRAGIPDDAIVLEVVPPTVIQATLTDFVRPTLPGTRIFAPYGCTLSVSGYRMIGDFWSGWYIDYTQPYFITNSHCTSVYVGYDGSTAGQPTLSSPIGFEIADPVPFTNAQEPDCPVSRNCRWSDAALFQYDPGVSVSFPNVPNVSGLTITGTRPIAGSGVPWFLWNYHPVRMIGSSSGQTTGAMTNTCVRVPVYIGSAYQGVDMLCQYQATYSSMGGDSGAPILSQESDPEVGFYGVHWGIQYSPGSGSVLYATFSPHSSMRNELANASGVYMVPCSSCLLF